MVIIVIISAHQKVREMQKLSQASRLFKSLDQDGPRS